MKQLNIVVLSSLLLVLVVAFAGVPQTTAHASTLSSTSCNGNWKFVKSPLSPGGFHDLFSVSSTSATDVWAVGYCEPKGGVVGATIIHWNGSQWSVVNAATTFLPAPSLYSVAALATNDVWAVGHTSSFSQPTLTEHWDGNQWSIIPSPFVSELDSLQAVAAISATDVWAVGYSFSASALAMHWNGTQWSYVPTPNVGTTIYGLNGISLVPGTSPNKLWAVGDYIDKHFTDETLTESYC